MGTDHPTGILRVLSSRLTGACFGSFLGRPALVLWAGREASLCSGFSWALWGAHRSVLLPFVWTENC